MNCKSRFKEVMTRLGENNSVDDNLCRTLRKFVCIMYGEGYAKDINVIPFNKLTVKQNRENKYVGLSALPPCQATLKLHILRANRVAYLIKRSSVAQVEEPPLSDCSWDHEGRSFGLRKRIQCCRGDVDSHNSDKVMKSTLMSILKMIVCLTSLIEIRVTLAILNLLGPFLFVFDFLEIQST